VEIGRWVMREASIQNMKWQRTGASSFPVAVNVSSRQLRDASFIEHVTTILHETRLKPEFLEIEVTESALMQDLEKAREILNTLNVLGVKISIDDFGSGYSSLGRLKTLPIHSLKIDRFFFQHVIDDPRDAAIISAIISMAESLDLQVVAEGIETEAQLGFLQSLCEHKDGKTTCQRVQGFLFSKPVPPEQAATLIQNSGS